LDTAKLEVVSVALEPYADMKYSVPAVNDTLVVSSTCFVIAVPDVAGLHPTVFDVPADVPIAIKKDVPVPPERVGVTDVVVIVPTLRVVGAVKNSDLPLK
jgi:hypothetical protein